MARPTWSEDSAIECVQALEYQLARKVEEERQRRLMELRKETAVTRHAIIASLLFLLAVVCVPIGYGLGPDSKWAVWLLFFSPVLAGVSGSTIRLVFDFRQGTVPLSPQSAITTAALGLVAGGVAGLLFISAQVATISGPVSGAQAAQLVPFGVGVGFIAGLTLDAVFRKLIASDVIEISSVEVRKGS
jgi:hypothetical protein